jgi:predicted AAA+ superfamily ATPase
MYELIGLQIQAFILITINITLLINLGVLTHLFRRQVSRNEALKRWDKISRRLGNIGRRVLPSYIDATQQISAVYPLPPDLNQLIERMRRRYLAWVLHSPHKPRYAY